jgi:hypothetical protein
MEILIVVVVVALFVGLPRFVRTRRARRRTS